MPFANYESFAACVADQVKKGHTKAAAHRICGEIQNRAESESRIEKLKAWFKKILDIGTKNE